MMGAAFDAERFDVTAAECYRISRGDTVKLAIVRAPDEHWNATVVFEVWDPGGSQPFNSHPESVETFWFLAGEGTAVSDGRETEVRAGSFLVLPPGSVHRIINTGSAPLYAITTMLPDAGFAELIRSGIPEALTAGDVRVAQGGCWSNFIAAARIE